MQNQISRALIFDCVYDSYKGVVAYIKVVEGSFKTGDQLYLIHTHKFIDITEVGHFTPDYKADKTISHGQIGYVVTGEKSVRNIQIGDTMIGGLPKKRKITEDTQSITEDEQKITEDKGKSNEEEKKKVNDLTYKIIGCAMEVHKYVGGGVREKNYQLALISELKKQGFKVDKEVKLDLSYKNEKLATQYVDLLVEDKVIIELKSKGFLQDIDYKQLRTYLNSGNFSVGLLLDFGGRKLLYRRLEKDYSPKSNNIISNSRSSSSVISPNPQSSSSVISPNPQSSSDSNLQLSSLAIPGFKRVKPYVYAGVYPIDSNDYDKLKDSLEKLSMNDSAIEYELEDSKALGFGFRCGFLGMLHMDIVKERLSREYNMETIFTIPTVVYLVKSKNLSLEAIKSGNNIQYLITSGLRKELIHDKELNQLEDLTEYQIEKLKEKLNSEFKGRLVVRSGADMIEHGLIDEIREPISTVEIVGPNEFAGNIMQLCQDYRGKLKSMEYIDETRVVRHYELPMGEIIIDFYDRLKSATKGYATMNYEFKSYEEADLVKLDIIINNEKVEALSRVVHSDSMYYKGRNAVEKLKELIPRHLFIIPIQAGVGTKIIARETISAMKKDVLAKCYGGDVSRKRKLLEKQKEGKKKMKSLGNVNVPSDVFIKMVARS